MIEISRGTYEQALSNVKGVGVRSRTFHRIRIIYDRTRRLTSIKIVFTYQEKIQVLNNLDALIIDYR